MKGRDRESGLPKSAYFGEIYLSMKQLCSLSHQIHLIGQLKPATVLEVGIGNGFTSSFLKRAGVDVCTVDINPALAPDIVCELSDLPRKLSGRSFDLVVCCEVLEHLPFEEFENSVKTLALYSSRLLLTLPSYATWLGFGGFVNVPKFNRLLSVGFKVQRTKNLAADAHFWELGHAPETSRANIKSVLSKYYANVDHNVFHLNRYHEYFLCAD